MFHGKERDSALTLDPSFLSVHTQHQTHRGTGIWSVSSRVHVTPACVDRPRYRSDPLPLMSLDAPTLGGQARGEGPALGDQLTTGGAWSLTSPGRCLRWNGCPFCFSGRKVVSPSRGWIRLPGLLLSKRL